MITGFRVLALGAALAVCASVAWAQQSVPTAPAPMAPAVPDRPKVQAPPPPAAARPTPTAKKAPPRKPAEAKPGVKDAECAWVGKRIVSLLARDDVDAAGKFVRFYNMFGCPESHVGAAFRCVVSDNGGPAAAKVLGDRVEQCWERPSMKFLGR